MHATAHLRSLALQPNRPDRCRTQHLSFSNPHAEEYFNDLGPATSTMGTLSIANDKSKFLQGRKIDI